MPNEKFKGFTTCTQVSSGLSRLQRITREGVEVRRAFMKAKEQFNIGKALMTGASSSQNAAGLALQLSRRFLVEGAGSARKAL